MRMDTEAVDRPTASVNGKRLGDQDVLELTVKDGKPEAKLNGKEVEVKDVRIDGPRGARQDRDNALAWTREYGKGRVFYTALGHRDELWKDERFRKHVLGGLRYVLRLEDADATPSAAPQSGSR
jgi:hypothetical protein